MKALIIGYGSIGQRHARILASLGCSVAILSRQTIADFPHYFALEEALTHWQPDYIVIANPTHEHHPTLTRLAAADFTGRVLVEKPLFQRVLPLPVAQFSHTAVAYNLRCHPLLLKLKQLVAEASQMICASIYVGSYLPHWRSRDYRQSYSARQQEGGGVLRDLSHELDYVFWLFGPWQRLTAMGGHLSHLEIESDDVYSLLLETPSCPSVTIQMNYLDRVPRRKIVVNSDRHTIRVDLCDNTLTIDDRKEAIKVGRDETYRAEHETMLAGQIEGLCSLEEAAETLFTIEAAERAARSFSWLQR